MINMNKHHNFRTGLLISIFIVILVIIIGFLGRFFFTEKGDKYKEFEVALITDSGNIDDNSYNQFSYDGIKEYCKPHKIKYKYYKPADTSATSNLSSVDKAVKNGARIIICPDSQLSETVYQAQDRYPDTSFVLVDSEPVNNDGTVTQTSKNVKSILFDDDEAGFLAGYVAAVSGYHNPSVLYDSNIQSDMHYYYGFLQGVNYYAKEADTTLSVRGKNITSMSKDKIEKYTKDLFKSNTDVMFLCNKENANILIPQVKKCKGAIINAGGDLTYSSSCVKASINKKINIAVHDCIKNYYDKKFDGGKPITYSATNNGIEMSFNKKSFKSSDQKRYTEIYKKLADGSIMLLSDTTVNINDLELDHIKVLTK